MKGKMETIKVLVVDDEYIICKNICSKLHRLNHPYEYQPFEASSLTEALQIFNKCRPQIVITDICMPNGNGLTLVSKIHRTSPDTIIFVLSGYDNFLYVRNAFLYGANDYLLKPLSESELDEKIITQMKLHGRPSIDQNLNKPGIMHTAFLQMVDQYIIDNINRPVTMLEIADKAKLSYNYFSKHFKEAAGMSFPKYVNMRKMEWAKGLLLDPGARIKEISEKAGFTDAGHFSRVFKKLYGVYPTEYRESIIPDKSAIPL
jgi:two-component system, response regulator YesN